MFVGLGGIEDKGKRLGESHGMDITFAQPLTQEGREASIMCSSVTAGAIQAAQGDRSADGVMSRS